MTSRALDLLKKLIIPKGMVIMYPEYIPIMIFRRETFAFIMFYPQWNIFILSPEHS